MAVQPRLASSIDTSRAFATAAACALGAGARRMHAALRAGLLMLALLLVAARPCHAAALELPLLQAQDSEQGVMLTFETRFDLPAGVSEALQKGVALHFVATAEVVRPRWYWRDKRIAQATRLWRLSYQPLTFSYRVSLGGLSQTYRSLSEALRAVQSSAQWRIAEPLTGGDEGSCHLEFSYRLDTDQLPRPLQIGIGSQPEWNLRVDRTVSLSADNR
ncbi:uncharacterized protein DUF4390 [Sphaerotilus hippei]|uniref:Uncharacterized protein DUF4390 n=1 Tax=Sphaerotilus hippei TaxID=744406 RepID=A0A318GZU4_9BURK|nr:DUF4390 domain-containing protein [Sphaerotilus hippei]PXW93514.1 uncharacterized protein DUF4390 [Sphaerotilus hippei]